MLQLYSEYQKTKIFFP